jgi:hypothetical protein
VLTGLSLEGTTPLACGVDPINDLFPRAMGDLYERQRLIVLGRYTDCPAGLTLVVSGDEASGGRSARSRSTTRTRTPATATSRGCGPSRRSPGSSTSSAPPGPTRSVQQLDSLRDDPRLAELIDEVVRLSTTYGILTEYTAFLAAEEGVLANRAEPRVRSRARCSAFEPAAPGRGRALGRAQPCPAAFAVADARMAVRRTFKITADSVPAVRPRRRRRGRCEPLPAGAVARPDLDDRWTEEHRDDGPDRRARHALQPAGPLGRREHHQRRTRQLADPESDRPEPDETVAFATDRYFEIAAARRVRTARA